MGHVVRGMGHIVRGMGLIVGGGNGWLSRLSDGRLQGHMVSN